MQWAHFPHIHFGLKLDGNKQAKLDQGDTSQKTNGFYWYLWNGILWLSASFFCDTWISEKKKRGWSNSQSHNSMGDSSEKQNLASHSCLIVVYVFPFPINEISIFLWLYLYSLLYHIIYYVELRHLSKLYIKFLPCHNNAYPFNFLKEKIIYKIVREQCSHRLLKKSLNRL